MFFSFLGCYLTSSPKDQNIAALKVEYRQTDTPSERDDDVPRSRGGASSTHGDDAPTEDPGDTAGIKAKVHPLKPKTSPET